MTTSSPVPDNQLLRLFRFAHRQQENFTTESFAHVLQYLLVLEPDRAAAFLNWLTGSDFFCHGYRDQCSVRTQFRTKQHGIPDVLIEGKDFDVVLEVKLDGSLGAIQAQAYLDALRGRGQQRRRLVALLGSTPANKLPDDPVLKTATWGALGVELRKASASSNSEVVHHLIDQFIGLLNHLHLMPLQVRSGLSEELHAHREWASANPDKPSIFKKRISSIDRLRTMEHTDRLRNLLLQMDSVLTRTPGVDRHRFDSGPYSKEPWIGFNLNDMAYFFFVSLNSPETVLLQRFRGSVDPKAFDGSIGDLERDSKGVVRWRAKLDLLDPAEAFFDVDEAKQQQCLEAFFQRAFAFGSRLPS